MKLLSNDMNPCANFRSCNIYFLNPKNRTFFHRNPLTDIGFAVHNRLIIGFEMIIDFRHVIISGVFVVILAFIVFC